MYNNKLFHSPLISKFVVIHFKGTASPELQSFLLHELTEKGLKKLGHNIENSYSTIQGLALKHLQSVLESLLFQLTEMLGMAKWYDHYGILGLSGESMQEVTRELGVVMLKTRELVDVIESSLKSFKAFFQWLYSAILRLSDEPIPNYIKQSSQQDVVLVANFLQDQLKVDKNGKFNLERVGQYFEDKELKSVSSYGDTPWTRFVANNELLRNSPLILHHNSNSSLVSLANALHDNIGKSFTKLSDTISNSFQCKATVYLANYSNTLSTHVTQISTKSPVAQNLVFSLGAGTDVNKIFLANLKNLTDDDETLSVKATSFYLSSLPSDEEQYSYKVLDVKFYDSDIATVLLKEQQQDEGDELTLLVQVPLNVLQDDGYISLNKTDYQHRPLTDNSALEAQDVGPKLSHWRKIQGFYAGSIAVSGSRKVCCMLSKSKRRVKLFDMDAEDDEEEEDDEEDVSRNETREMEQDGELSFNQ